MTDIPVPFDPDWVLALEGVVERIVAPLLSAVGDLTSQVTGLRRDNQAITANASKLKRAFAVAVFGLVLDMCVTVGFYYNNRQTSHAQHQLSGVVAQLAKANNAIHAACLTSNDQAAKQHELWNSLLALPSSNPPPDPKVLAAFNHILDTTFPQQDCAKA